MPIFQDDDLGAAHDAPVPESPTKTPPRPTTPLESVSMGRKLSEESIRTELCEGPVPDMFVNHPASSPSNGFSFPIHGTSDRAELIERLKRGESPTWLPSKNLESLLDSTNVTPKKQAPNPPNSSPLLPSPNILEARPYEEEHLEQAQAGLQIERPRSALHSGDFTEGPQESVAGQTLLTRNNGLFGSEGQPWLATSSPRNFSPFQLDSRFPPVDSLDTEPAWRSRPPSLSSSYSSSFVLKPPTSPLVQSESNEDLELSAFMNPIDITPASQMRSRRHTLQTSHSMRSAPSIPTSLSYSRPLPHLRRDSTCPYQAHQPRRSLTSNPTPLPPASPSTPSTPNFLHSRRPSYSESSPLHASMVGSYEESILRGRMSTTPSKPLDFVAQIGVLGLGKCKSSLRCPAHVTLPFPAVFYSYETTSHGRVGKSEDGPSPYVGQIDLENGLPSSHESKGSKRKRVSSTIIRGHSDDLDMLEGPNTNQLTDQEIRRAEKQKRRSPSPRSPPGGSYRIPEKGQLQIVIKNPNKTAVKLFLIPYDLAGMEPGTKTFIRQRIYSAGPVIDTALSSTSPNTVTNPIERPTLRYLVHIHICSPSRGRFYLYKSIRVVFANRVPDGKEKLRNEISTPEPRFSVYKPGRDSAHAFSLAGGAGASLTAEKAYRRRSSGFALGVSRRTYDPMEGITQALEKGLGGDSGFRSGPETSGAIPIQPIPFSLSRKLNQDNEQVQIDMQSSTSSKSSQPLTSLGDLSMSWDSESHGIEGYGKLKKGDVGYGGNAFSTFPDEGLLAKKLRGLGVGLQNTKERQDSL
ncbi:hypothetical protein BJ875DRAFT_239108 [Amylocarpus encephaloides]|uniref:Atos-like conserved domain-containing protein n=1 Tax=Amylocarpus encephaloides TaxID=45428 RepID=A0A9P7YMC3_9HELO|nr:hypothetical protein BJ875DRAFT_239108 [Amylocarpus encephaloides]